MKKFVISVSIIMFVATSGYAATLETEAQKIGYAIGMNIGMNMKMQELDIDPEQVSAGLVAAFKGEPTLMEEDQMAQILMAFQQQMQVRDMEKMAAEATLNTVASQQYLEKNSKKKGVVTTKTGLQYRVLSKGKGASPKADSTVDVHYRGTLVDGTEFDSSYSRGEPATFPVGNVIPGWTEALQLMKEGDKWEIAIPAELAYADQGAPPVIPPSSALIFEVELLKVH
ncbi:FKBP-type peptidyl-prolyl cis-trans isomerase [Pelovirga terrestris]|uniref:Peptidyl-prolyl cis-trans isomerase n=1 Tax=Pelovirga terrestris TaxID=2771352 RepID=A0A8J6QYA7_9BACT|nr:FKBP-type peptidyl-prolyl cis-trans isomerase [Pelovirga terrestris]MBD1401676.1 FKBP-type peptidyl-prolyl cis-trans isomerase [Pelovirga terrestris]